MAKILFLAGSPRKGGNTDDCVEYAGVNLRDAGHSVEIVRIHDQDIDRCMGCRACMELRRCVNDSDDFMAVWRKVKDAELLVLAAPVYWYGPPGAMKDFVDRTHGSFVETRPLDGMRAALLSVAGDDGCWEPHEKIMSCWLTCYGARLLPQIRIVARERGDAVGSEATTERLDRWCSQLKTSLVAE